MNNSSYTQVSQSEGRQQFRGLEFPGSRAASTCAAGTRPPSDSILLKTAGNALQAICRHEIHDNDDLVAVCCPENVSAGDRIRVLTPDGSGREVETIVPQGISAGRTFLVRLPPQPENFYGTNTDPVFVVGTPASPTERQVVASSDLDVGNSSALLDAAIVPLTPPVAMPVNESIAPSAPAVTDHYGQNLILVEVPIGARPGDKLQVSTNDGRLIEVAIPPNVTEFYVRVPPGPGKSQVDTARPGSNVRQPPQPESRSNKTDDNILLVKVPDGFHSGDRMQVTVPDGRLIEATVPPGNVKEFYVRIPPPNHGSTSNRDGTAAAQPFGALKSFLGVTG